MVEISPLGKIVIHCSILVFSRCTVSKFPILLWVTIVLSLIIPKLSSKTLLPSTWYAASVVSKLLLALRGHRPTQGVDSMVVLMNLFSQVAKYIVTVEGKIVIHCSVLVFSRCTVSKFPILLWITIVLSLIIPKLSSKTLLPSTWYAASVVSKLLLALRGHRPTQGVDSMVVLMNLFSQVAKYIVTVEGSSCRWIGWYDPEMCARSRMIIPGLLRRRNELEERLEVAQGDVWKWKIYLVLSWILFLIVYALG
ncbi:zinc finger, GRF-type [Artemisia annua]|uniref:Zinc finger, GRF-type n=1 Tax=Artemisia annua TaxID=35608 RepID=A0A2U1N212_ARTAN|nr:zinc finger, GRF-type [Artemisia annua]